MVADRDGLELLARKAAWAHDRRPADAARLSSMAFLFGCEVAERAATSVLHFHGGYGFMLEYDIQLYFQRIKAWSLLGDRAAEATRLADRLWPRSVAEPSGSASFSSLRGGEGDS
jgi:alkylation response protein AidB-like acyl-CoA dehydrogenase